MLKIDKEIPKCLIEDYVNTIYEYLNDKKKIDVNDKSLVEQIIAERNFDSIYNSQPQKVKNRIDNYFIKDKKESKKNKKNKKNEFLIDTYWDDARKIGVKYTKNNEKNEIRYSSVKELIADMQKNLETNVCPYCGQNHIDVIEIFKNDNEVTTKSGRKRRNNKKAYNGKLDKILVPCMDHFFPKSEYPAFSLSLYNLVPSCYRCNSNCKSEKEILNSNGEFVFLNPFREGFDDNVKFNFSFKSLDEQKKFIRELTGNKNAIDNIPIILVKNDNIKIDTENIEAYLERCRQSNKVFHLQEIYDKVHRKNAVDLVNKYIWFKKSYITHFFRVFLKICDNDKLRKAKLPRVYSYFYRIYNKLVNCYIDNNIALKNLLDSDFEFLFGRWFESENDLKEPLSKFYRDIYEQITEPHVYKPL